MTEQDDNTMFLAVSDKHGWARHDDKEQAIQNALQNSSYIDQGDEVEITLYRCEQGTTVTGMGYIGVWERDDGEEMEEGETISDQTHTLRGADPLDELENKTYKFKGWDSRDEKSFMEV